MKPTILIKYSTLKKLEKNEKFFFSSTVFSQSSFWWTLLHILTVFDFTWTTGGSFYTTQVCQMLLTGMTFIELWNGRAELFPLNGQQYPTRVICFYCHSSKYLTVCKNNMTLVNVNRVNVNPANECSAEIWMMEENQHAYRKQEYSDEA